MDINFWNEGGTGGIITHVRVTMPNLWSPKLYFGALSCCIRHDKCVLIDRVERPWGDISDLTTTNEVHWLYSHNCRDEIEDAIIKGGGGIILLL